MKDQEITLRCFAERLPDGQWQAFCIDINVAAQAPSKELAKKKLDAMVEDYVSDLNGVDSDHFDDLFPRLAPLPIRARYHRIALMFGLYRLLGNRWLFAKSHATAFRERYALHH